MSNKKVALISVIVSLIASSGWQLALSSTHASGSAQPATLQEPPPTKAPVTIWEYKVLVFPATSASRTTLRYYGPIAYAPLNLEDEINKLAEQGYVVEFQTQSSPSGTDLNTGYFAPSSEIVVTLKRERK